MLQVTIEGLLLGLSSGAYCLGACFVFFMPYLLAEAKEKTAENLKNILFFLSGRLISYIIFALVIGFLGGRFRNVFTDKMSHLSLVVVSSLMLVYGLTKNFGELRFCRFILTHFTAIRMPFILGLFLGLNPCMPFLTGAIRIWTLGSVFLAVILFSAFFLGSSLYLIPLVFISYLNRIGRLEQIGAILSLISGIWFLFIGLSGLI